MSPSRSGWAQCPEAHTGSRRVLIQTVWFPWKASWRTRHTRASNMLAWLSPAARGHQRTLKPRAGSAGGSTRGHPYLADLFLAIQWSLAGDGWLGAAVTGRVCSQPGAAAAPLPGLMGFLGPPSLRAGP